MTRIRVALILSVALAACRCREQGPAPLEPSQLSADPIPLTFEDTWVGRERELQIEILNRDGATSDVEVVSTDPFLVSFASLRLVRGQASTLTVTFAPSTSGSYEGVLRVGPLEVPMQGKALAVPECGAQACEESAFDFDLGRCMTQSKPDGLSCENACIEGGQCLAGSCAGRLRGCDDGDRCTVDGCSLASGCSHAPVVCPPSTNPCQVPSCTNASGCGFVDADDGVLCGPDDCLSANVSVCLSGACVQRVRPASSRCTNRWVPAQIPLRNESAMAFEAARGRLILFGGQGYSDTWELHGARWSERTPPNAPPPIDGALAFDTRRQRLVLFGQSPTRTSQTWEWDGLTWLERRPVRSPPPRSRPALAYDPDRGRTVLFGGLVPPVPDGGINSYVPITDTWEWDGTEWTEKATAAALPSANSWRPSLAFDGNRRRVVALVHDGVEQSSVWEFDGTTWSRQQLPAQASFLGIQPVLAWDEGRRRLVLRSGYAGATPSSIWESDGVSWSQAGTFAPRTPAELMTWDGARQRVVLFNASTGALSEWDGARLSSLPVSARPSAWSGRLVWDPLKQKTLLVSDGTPFETWEFDGRDWAKQLPAQSPPARSDFGLTWDRARQRAVLFGGRQPAMDVWLDDTWEWDGATWELRSTQTGPPARQGLGLVYDSVRERTVLFGGFVVTGTNVLDLTDTWEWDGSSWVARSAMSPSRSANGVVFDPVRRLVVQIGMGNQTATWDGAQWLSAPGPPVAIRSLVRNGLSWDSRRQRIVSAGGTLPFPTWEWDGTSWSDLGSEAANLPSQGSMAYDEQNDRQIFYSQGSTWLLLP